MRALARLLLLVGLVLAGSALAPLGAAADVAPGTTTLTSRPPATTSATTAALGYTTTQVGASFECTLTGPGRTDPTPTPCGDAAADPAQPPAPGSTTYADLVPGAYRFSVRATTPSSEPSGPPVVSPVATASWTVAAGPVTTVTSGPAARTIEPTVTFGFGSDQGDVTFECRLTGQGRSTAFAPCGTRPLSTGVAERATFTVTKPGPYTFAVRATSRTGAVGPVAEDDYLVMCSIRRSLCALTAPSAYSVPGGARFNNPLSTSAYERRLLNHVIDTVKSMPGFAVADPAYCSDDPADYPSRIRISVYSVTTTTFARAMVAAHRRCVAAQILMNNHLSKVTSGSIQIMRDGLGSTARDDRRSFAAMCGEVRGTAGGCRGGAVLHSKFYLFDAVRKAPNGRTTIRDTVMVGSPNLTGNAAIRQWNTLLTVRSNPTLHAQYAKMFDLMKLNRRENRTYDFRTGPYLTQFWPRGATDPEKAALSSIRCKGVSGGAGYRGRTVVYINMHAWFDTRGYALAQQVRGLYDRGCYVRVLYSFMSYSVFKKLKAGTGSRMAVRRSVFSTDGDKYADVYTHFKVIAASGNVGGNSAARVTWTGSMNYTGDGVGFDEVMMRVASGPVFRAYRDRWNYINQRKSSGTYANFSEPLGGGRPDPNTADARRMVQPTEQLTVLPPRTSEDGQPIG